MNLKLIFKNNVCKYNKLNMFNIAEVFSNPNLSLNKIIYKPLIYTK